MEFLQDPNVIYLLLMAGLWISATGTYIPGHRGGGDRWRRLDPRNAVLVEPGGDQLDRGDRVGGGGVALLLAAAVQIRMGEFAIGGLVLQAVASFFLFAEASVSPVLIAVGVLLAFAYHRGILRSILKERQQLSSTQKDEFLVGERGRVMATIEDRGTVHVRGELWTARSRLRLESGTEIVVTQQDGLELHVEKAKRQEAE